MPERIFRKKLFLKRSGDDNESMKITQYAKTLDSASAVIKWDTICHAFLV